MATVKEQLRANLILNLKAHKELQVTVLRAVLGEIQSQEKSGKVAVEFDDTKILEVIARLVKQRRESATIYANANADVRAKRETAEADFLATYLPAQLTLEEVEAYVDATIATFESPTLTDFGAVMKVVAPAVKGQADGKLVSDLVRLKLSAERQG